MRYCNERALVIGALLCLSCAGEDQNATVFEQPSLPTVPVSPSPAEAVDSVSPRGPAAVESGVTSATPPSEPPGALIIQSEPMAVVEDPKESECASAGVESRTLPVTIFFALDGSRSMVSGKQRALRWEPVTVALKAFLNDPGSAGLDAAMQLFPTPTDHLNVIVPEARAYACRVAPYRTADVKVQALPDSGDFQAFIDAAEPDHATPTNSMFRGIIQQAEEVLNSDPEARAAMVMLSDGDPSECADDNRTPTEVVSATVAAVADRIPTYVIGVGENLDNLNAIAKAGGTETALLIDPADPEATRLKILERLGEIRGQVASCEVIIPEPPEGKRLEPNAVFAKIHLPNSASIEVPYEADCLTGAGFRYDDEDAPERILLCPQACGELRQSGASVEVVFGCAATRPTVR